MELTDRQKERDCAIADYYGIEREVVLTMHDGDNHVGYYVLEQGYYDDNTTAVLRSRALRILASEVVESARRQRRRRIRGAADIKRAVRVAFGVAFGLAAAAALCCLR